MLNRLTDWVLVSITSLIFHLLTTSYDASSGTSLVTCNQTFQYKRYTTFKMRRLLSQIPQRFLDGAAVSPRRHIITSPLHRGTDGSKILEVLTCRGCSISGWLLHCGTPVWTDHCIVEGFVKLDRVFTSRNNGNISSRRVDSNEYTNDTFVVYWCTNVHHIVQ